MIGVNLVFCIIGDIYNNEEIGASGMIHSEESDTSEVPTEGSSNEEGKIQNDNVDIYIRVNCKFIIVNSVDKITYSLLQRWILLLRNMS